MLRWPLTLIWDYFDGSGLLCFTAGTSTCFDCFVESLHGNRSFNVSTIWLSLNVMSAPKNPIIITSVAMSMALVPFCLLPCTVLASRDWTIARVRK